jgi:hypothetical protein
MPGLSTLLGHHILGERILGERIFGERIFGEGISSGRSTTWGSSRSPPGAAQRGPFQGAGKL